MTTTTLFSSPGVFARIVRSRFALLVALGTVSIILSGTAAFAQQPGTGVRAGVSSDPTQFYFGAHFDTGYIFDRLSFRPNAEIGVGDDVTSVTGNFEFVYWWPVPRHRLSIYAGGGPAVNLYRWGDNNRRHEPHTTDVQPGFNILGGVALHGGLFAEIKLGFIDSPEAKFGIGYTWK